MKSSNITEMLADLVVVGGVPEHVRSDIVSKAMSRGDLASAALGDDLRKV